MAPALIDFSIESEHTILLSFLDGTRRRVRPTDLHRYLDQDDVEKVKRAISMRKHFIKQVLPPGAICLLVGATVMLGLYDASRIAQIIESDKISVTEVANQSHRPSSVQVQSHESYGIATDSELKSVAAENGSDPAHHTTAPGIKNSIDQLVAPVAPRAPHNQAKNNNNQVKPKSQSKPAPPKTTSLMERAINKVLH